MFGLPASTDIIAGRLLRRPTDPAIVRAREALLARQRTDGHWIGEVHDASGHEAKFILLMKFLGQGSDHRIRNAAQRIGETQRPDGGWNRFPGGRTDLSLSVQSYFALKLAGHSADEPRMMSAANLIRHLGGASEADPTTHYFLALLGQIPFARCPAIPPELVLVPSWSSLSLHKVAAWVRVNLIPMSIIWAHQPIQAVPPEKSIRELFLGNSEEPRSAKSPTSGWFSLRAGLFHDRWVKRCERWGITPFRRRALRKAVAWMREHYIDSDGLGATCSAIMWNLIALRCLNVPDHDPEFLWAFRHLEQRMVVQGDSLRIPETGSPVRDTALAVTALATAGEGPDSPSIRQGVRSLLDREVRRPGDWSMTVKGLEPGGWCAQHRNGFYPDMVTTASVLIALELSGHARTPAARSAVQRGLHWLVGMQNRDGGWALFDRGKPSSAWENRAFADPQGMSDVSSPEITGRVLECLGRFGYRLDNDGVRRAKQFLESSQAANGSWPEPSGGNRLFSTWSVLGGLEQTGFDPHESMVRKAIHFLKDTQQENGAWGEACDGKASDGFSTGEPTASHTAWGVLSLISAGEGASTAAQRGLDYLRATQQPDGSWIESAWTACGTIPHIHGQASLFPACYPLIALARSVKPSD